MRKLVVVLGAGVVAAVWWTRRRAASAQRSSMPPDVSFMVAMHDAFRRDLARLERATSEPAASRGGWDVFREELEFHHRAEDEDLWPALREHVRDRDELQVIDEMEHEHAAITPAIDAVARSFDDQGDLVATIDGLVQLVRTHLEHEEQRALPIVERRFTAEDWHRFLSTERRKRGRQGAQFLCWVLDDATTADTNTVMHEIPPPGRVVYRRILKPRYDARQLWSTGERDLSAQPHLVND